jgi:hypothetical protein
MKSGLLLSRLWSLRMMVDAAATQIFAFIPASETAYGTEAPFDLRHLIESIEVERMRCALNNADGALANV